MTSDHGTDITAKIGQGRKGWCVAGTIGKQEGMDLYCCAFPDGEVGVVPLEGTGQRHHRVGHLDALCRRAEGAGEGNHSRWHLR